MNDYIAGKINDLLDKAEAGIVENVKKQINKTEIEKAVAESIIRYATSDKFRDILIDEILKNI